MPMPSSWTHLPPFDVERPGNGNCSPESDAQSRVILHSSAGSNGAPGKNQAHHTPLRPTTILHPSISPDPEPVVTCLQGPSCPHCVGVGPRAPPRPMRRAAPLNAFSSTSFSLKPWQWPRRTKPAKPRRERESNESPMSDTANNGNGNGSRLFFTAPYRYFGFGRWSSDRSRTMANGNSSLRPGPIPTPASGVRPTFSRTDCCSSSSFGSTSSEESQASSGQSHSSAPRSLPSCQVHSPVRIRPTASHAFPAASPYYYLRKYGTPAAASVSMPMPTTPTDFDDEDDKDSWSSSSALACCKKINKYKSRKNSDWSWSWSWSWPSYGYTSGSGNGITSGKRRAQALRAFQLICMLLCILGIATVLVITILASLARSVSPRPPWPSTDFYDGGVGVGVGVSLIDDLLVSNIGGDIEPEDLPAVFKNSAGGVGSTGAVSIRDHLKAWLLGNRGAEDSAHDEADSPGYLRHNQLLNGSNFRFILNNEEMCQQTHTNTNTNTSTTSPSKLYFMILVHSAPKHFQQRQAIRSTWGSVKSIRNLGIRLAFLLGQPQNEPPSSNSTIKFAFTRNNPAELLQRSIQSEQSLYGDIVQGNFPDSYHNLIYKHLMGYKWVLQFCDANTTFVLKTDDDVFIDIFQLLDFTTRHYGLRPVSTLICNVYEGTFPIRARAANLNSSLEGGLTKWAVSRDEYPLAVYPKYCGGLAYLITPDVIRDLVRVHEQIMNHNQNQTLQFWIDDVYVTGVLRELAGREPFYMNLRYAYDTKLYHPWMLSDGDKDGAGGGVSEIPEVGGTGTQTNAVHVHENTKSLHKIPYMIVHLEQTSTLSEEMNRLWRKTMRVWQN